MALSAVLRRTVTSATTLTSRVICGGRTGLQCSASSTFLVRPLLSWNDLARPEPLSRPVLTPPSRFFSAESGDAGLLKAIDEELKSLAGDEYFEDPQKKFPFEINDQPGTNNIVLTREFEGEKIVVHASLPTLASQAAGGGEDDENATIPLVVKVTKEEGDPGLEFACTGYADEVCIDFISIAEKNSETEDGLLAYEGPEFSDLDENLQKAFTKYLEIRGISGATVNYLHEYMTKKDERECLRWLKNLKKFMM